jgi:GTP-binding protein
MFIDSVKIYAHAGHGGNGCVALLREAYRPKGGPCGGDGGKGGDIILEASHDINNLIAQYYAPRIVAKNGLPGQGKGKTGKSGTPVIVKVPCGTTIWSVEKGNQESATGTAPTPLKQSGEHMPEPPRVRQRGDERALEISLTESDTIQEEQLPEQPSGRKVVADLTEHGQRFLLCKVGRGGLGNQHFASSKNQTPRFAQPGSAGEEDTFQLELRMLAEIGLVGYPNAGKSTLLTSISKAKPKIAPYPFTTLHPQIGVMEFEDYHRMTVCDIPGLIDGAHQNVGLGHAFLRHVQRCKALVLLIDMAGVDARKPWDDFKQLREELKLYDPAMLEKPFFVAANKMDIPEAQELYRSFRRKVRGVKVLKLSAAFDDGVAKLKQSMREIGSGTD